MNKLRKSQYHRLGSFTEKMLFWAIHISDIIKLVIKLKHLHIPLSSDRANTVNNEKKHHLTSECNN